MRQNSKYRSSLNQVAAIDEKKVKHLGKNYASIDFEIKEHVNPNEFRYGKMKRVDVTYSELNHIMRTASAAMQACDMAYRMGKWGKATR